jgi:hypothetical protein
LAFSGLEVKKKTMKKHRIAALTTGLVVAAIATAFAVLPAAAALRAERSAAAPSIHRPSRVAAAASPSTLFRSRLVPPSASHPSTFRAQTRAQAVSN